MDINAVIQESTLWNLLIRFVINIITLYVLIGLIYYKFSKKEEYLFSFALMGIMIFLISAVLGTIELHVGTALGLFALFAIIRFRTVQYSVKDITYVFVIIGISVINSQANIPPPVLGAIVINLSILVITYLLELFLNKNSMKKLVVEYNNTELLKPERTRELLKDLSRQTGQNIKRFKIRRINLRKKRAELEVWFRQEPGDKNL